MSRDQDYRYSFYGQGQWLAKLHCKVTVRVVLPEILPKLAVMVVAPAVTGVARPLLLTVATDVSDELQVTCEVKS